MMRAVVLLLVLLLLPVEAVADGATWHKRKVVVRDYTSAVYKPYVADMVAAFNATLPTRAPRLIYRAKPERSCRKLNRRAQRGKIAVCLSGGEWDLTAMNVTRGEIHWAIIVLMGDDPPEEIHNTICHELMHAVTNAPDDYRDPHLTTSCVQGTTPYPGPWDAAYARRVYRKARYR